MLRYFIILLLSAWGIAAAAAPRTRPEQLRLDSSDLKIRRIDQRSIEAYNGNKDFNYSEGLPPEESGWWSRFWRWFWDFFRENSKASNTQQHSANYKRVLYIILAFVALLFAILKLKGMPLAGIFSGDAKSTDVDFEVSAENIYTISFGEEIEKAVNLKNYRLAVRFLYLKTIKDLNEAGRIKWEPDKTNAKYVEEIKNAEQKKQFQKLTRQFEYVWYGDFDLSNTTFGTIEKSFRDFNILMR